MADLFGLSESDVDRLAALLAAFESGRLNAPVSARPQPDDRGPQWCALGKATTSLSAASGPNYGSGTVARWKSDPLNAGTYGDTTLTHTALNPTSAVIPAGSWGILYRDPWTGQYWFEPYSAGPNFGPVSVGGYYAENNTSVTVSGSAGSLAVAFVIAQGYQVPSPPIPAGPITPSDPGWTELAAGTFHGGVDSYWVGYRRVIASDVTYGWGATNGLATLYSSAVFLTNASNPVVGPVGTGVASTTAVAPSVDVPADGSILLLLMGNDGNGSYTAPSGMTFLISVPNVGNVFAATQNVSNGASGAKSSTISFSASDYVAVLVAVPPQGMSSVVPGISPIVSGVGPPPANSGYAGSVYYDVTDPINPMLYYKT